MKSLEVYVETRFTLTWAHAYSMRNTRPVSGLQHVHTWELRVTVVPALRHFGLAGPLNRPHSAPNRDLCDVTEFGQDPPKSDRSHYPKYKPLVFPAPEHDCSNPDYTGPRILTPRIKPCATPSVGISSKKFCWSEPLLVSGVPTPRPGKPIYSTPDDSAHVDDCGRLSHYSAREQSVVAPVISRHDHSRDPQSVQDTTENGCAGATVSMAGSDVAAGMALF